MNKKSFHYAFQISRTLIFEVNYYLLGNNKNKYYSTCAAQFNRPKTDFNQCGQAQYSLLPKNSIAFDFYEKYDKFHTLDVEDETYNSIVLDIEQLKNKYNYIEKFSDSGINFSELRELSKMKVK